MKHVKTLNTQTLNNTVKKGGCGECQTSCQSACKTSCTVGNQVFLVAVSSSLKTIFKKTERGIVLIHQYKNNGYNIVLDVYSGAVHVVDELCYDVIACLNEENEAHTPETLQEGKTFEGLKNALQDTYSEEELKHIFNR